MDLVCVVSPGLSWQGVWGGVGAGCRGWCLVSWGDQEGRSHQGAGKFLLLRVKSERSPPPVTGFVAGGVLGGVHLEVRGLHSRAWGGAW